jgi:hypothetical protein
MLARHWTPLRPREISPGNSAKPAACLISFVTSPCSSVVPSPNFSDSAIARNKQKPSSFANLEMSLQKKSEVAPVGSDLSDIVGSILNQYLIKQARCWLLVQRSYDNASGATIAACQLVSHTHMQGLICPAPQRAAVAHSHSLFLPKMAGWQPT